MRAFVIWCAVILATAATAFTEAPKPLEQGKAPQKAGASGKTKGLPKELTVDLGGGVKMDFVLIPAGSFMMGDEKGLHWEKPVHKVTITKPFYLGKYEVTQEQWQAVMDSNPSRFKGPKNPVEMVTWRDCQDFTAKLNEKSRAESASYSVPTEAQWEYACRAGTTTPWSFGGDPAKLGNSAWAGMDPNGTTHPVGQKKPNPWGLFDMHGNVWEWCADRWREDYYGKSPTDDPPGPAGGSARVLRGGGWFGDAALCRSANRLYNSPGLGSNLLGLRVSRVPADK